MSGLDGSGLTLEVGKNGQILDRVSKVKVTRFTNGCETEFWA